MDGELPEGIGDGLCRGGGRSGFEWDCSGVKGDIGLVEQDRLAEVSKLVGSVRGGSINNGPVDVVENFVPISSVIICSSRILMGKVAVSIRGHVFISVL
jgi:hypothetical protein